MSGLGHSRRFEGWTATSGLLPGADIVAAGRHVSKVPIADMTSAVAKQNPVTIFHEEARTLSLPRLRF